MRMMQVISDYIRRSILTIQGDLLVRGATIPERLAPGPAWSILTSQGAGALPIWRSPGIPVHARATLSANQSIPSGVWTKVELDTIDYDPLGHFDTVNHKYICSVAGTYIICSNIYLLSLGDTITCQLAVKTNGNYYGGYMLLRTGGSGSVSFASSDIIPLAINDYVELFIRHFHGAARDLYGTSNFVNYLALHRLSV